MWELSDQLYDDNNNNLNSVNKISYLLIFENRNSIYRKEYFANFFFPVMWINKSSTSIYLILSNTLSSSFGLFYNAHNSFILLNNTLITALKAFL